MKKLIYTLAATVMLGCAEDKGNYHYNNNDEITITGIRASYSRQVGGRLAIPVTLEHSVERADPKLSYVWEIDGQVVSTSKDLDIDVPTNMDFGTKLCRFTVTDEENGGMKYFQTFNFNLSSPFNWGYYMLTETESGETILAYFPVATPDRLDEGFEEGEVITATSISGVELGAKPSRIAGKFEGLGSLGYGWSMSFLTQEGTYPVIQTNNVTFMPTGMVSSSDFTDKEKGYLFAPEDLLYPRGGNFIFYISNGQVITYTAGMLYRPAQHERAHYWSNPVWSTTSMNSHLYVYDELSYRYYVVKPYQTDPVTGVVGDSYAYDNAIPLAENEFPGFEGHTIIGAPSIPGLSSPEEITVATANNGKVFLTTFQYHPWHGVDDEPENDFDHNHTRFVNQIELNVSGANDNSKAILGNTDWYFSAGNKIYISPVLAPSAREFVELPAEHGEIIDMKFSALSTLLVAVMYDPTSSHGYKGSIAFVDILTKEITMYPNVIHKCKALFSANSDGFGWGSMGDGK